MYTDIFVEACNLLTNISTLTDWPMYRDALRPTYWLAMKNCGGDEDPHNYGKKFIVKFDEIDARYNNRA